MKLTHVTLAFLWAFVVTVEAHHENMVAQNYGNIEGFLESPDGYGDPVGTPEAPYTRPEDLRPYDHGLLRQETTNIYRHPDDGLPSQAPYITVPVQPGTGDHGYWGKPYWERR